MRIGRILAVGGSVAAIVVGVASANPTTTLTGVTTLSGGNVILYEGGTGTAHWVHGVNPGVQNALAALVGHSVTVDGTLDNPSIPNSPVLVTDFVVNPGGALNGQAETITGPVRMDSAGDVIVDDQFGNGHVLQSTSAVSPATIASFVNKTATISGTANVTNPASYINWPIAVSSIA